MADHEAARRARCHPEAVVPDDRPVLIGFGGVAAVGRSGQIDLGGPKQRAVLGLLLLEPGSVVPLDRMIDRIWAGTPPSKAEASVRGYVTHLRKALDAAGLGSNRIAFRDRGYVLDVPPETVDLHRFAALADEGRRRQSRGDLVGARSMFSDAVELYGGPPLGAVATDLDLLDVTSQFEERRGEVVEALTEVRLALGEHAQLPAALASEIGRQPYRERLRAQLALALYRAGRPVDALRSINDARRLLRDDVGVDPGPELCALEAAILDHDEATLGWKPPARLRARATAVPAAVDRDLPGDLPLFGRAPEQTRIAALLDRLPQRGGVLVVGGEAGIGKSAVLRSLGIAARRRGFAVGVDRCPESAAGAPLRSWRSAVEPLLSQRSIPAAAMATEQEPAGARLTAQLDELDRLRRRDLPAVIVIDDLQWADDATLALLGFLAPEFERLRLLVAVGVRRDGPAELAPAVRDCLVELARTDEPCHLTLAGLGPAEIAEWAATRSGGAPQQHLVSSLVEATEGNPFFVRELLSLLEAEGRLGEGFDGSPVRVPHAVQDVIRRRTSRLPPECQRTLVVAAVIGRRFDLDVLAVVLELTTAEILDRLGPALDDGLVEFDDASPVRCAFSHALVSSALAVELNPSRLALLHARITDALEALRADDLEPWVEHLAHHATEGMLAGSAAKALAYSRRAAAAAAAAQSSAGVATQLRRAVDAAALLPSVTRRERRELLHRLGLALRDTGDLDGRPTLISAARLAEADGDLPVLAEILGELDVDSLWAGYDWSLHDPRVVAAVERTLGRSDLALRDRAMLTIAPAGELTYVDTARSHRLFAEAGAMAETLDDSVLSARALLRWFWSVSGPSGVGTRASIGDQLVDLDQRGALPARLRPLAHLARVSSALELGDGGLARRCVSSARALAHPIRTPTGWAHLQYAEAGIALLDGDVQRARAHAEALRPALQRVRRYTADSSPAAILAVVDIESGDVDAALGRLTTFAGSAYGGPIRWLEAWVLAEGGRLDAAREALAGFDGPLPDDWLLLPLTTAAVNAAARVGDLRFLRRQVDSLEPFADRFAFVGEGGPSLGPVGLAVAAAHLALGDQASARRYAARALVVCRRMGAVLWEPRLRELLASLPS